MAHNKTTQTENSVAAYLDSISDAKRRNDCIDAIEMMRQQTGFEPKMWGTAIVGFGTYHYKYDSGREGDAPLTGLSSRANAITFYLADLDNQQDLLKKLGKHKSSKGCVYVQKLEDIDTKVLMQMVTNSVNHYKAKYPI